MASSKRINVLIYSGPSTSIPSVRHATWTLRRLLGPNYAVHTLSADQLLKEPWPATCALLVIPGGADAGYCRVLNGDGNRRIKTYVQAGGKYLGLCAGGYYGSSKCEFEVGRKGWEVIGDRELRFYPGVCRGLAFPGFVYGSEKGARAVKIKANPTALGTFDGTFNSYYNGGGAFVNPGQLESQGVEVLASFEEELAVDAGSEKAAVVYCKVNDGAAVLTGPHPEFSGANLNRDEPSNSDYGQIIDLIIATDQQRIDFLKACLTKLGLEVSQEAQAVPSLSPLHLSSAQPGEIEELLQIWRKEGVLTSEGQSWCITGENDTFRVKENDTWSVDCLTAAVTDVPIQTSSTQTDGTSSRIPDYNALPKTLIPHTSSLPPPKETPHFNHAAFYKHLHTYNTHHPTLTGDFGRVLIYSEVLTSTQTILDKNPTWLSHLPIGTTATATTQVSGRGRGTNTWVSPPGSMMFSTVLKHPLSLSPTAPVVFVQYLAALAVVAGIHSSSSSSSDPSHARLPIKLKWPNDIYALHPDARASPEDPRSYVKIGGVLVNSSYAGGDYTLVVGVGLNLANPSPTTSVAALVRDFLPPSSTSSSSTAVPPPPPPQPEKVLASILVQFENLYARFCQTGWNERLERMYYDVWLHMDQVVTLEEHGGMKARIKGITRDWGMLVAEEVVDEGGRGGLRLGGGEGGGKRFELQSDSNSFDFFRGLVKRKV